MEGLAILIGASGFFGLVIAGLVQQRRLRVAMLRKAATNLGLTILEGFWDVSLRGKIDGHDVFVDRTSDEKNFYRILVIPRMGLPTHLRIGTENLMSRVTQALIGPDLKTGDAVFDRSVFVVGEGSHVLALFGQEVRPRLMDFVKKGEIQKAGLIRKQKTHWANGAILAAEVRAMVDLANALEGGGRSVAERLAENVRRDPCVEYRAKCLTTLQDEFAGDSLAKDVSREALQDPSIEVQLVAAGFLGEEGIHIVRSHLETALNSNRPPLQNEAIHLIGRFRWRPMVPAVKTVVEKADPAVAASGLLVVANLEGAGAEPFVLRCLEVGDPTVAAAAVNALAAMGSVASVEPLRRRAERSDLILRRRIASVIAQIQENLGDVEKGTLSMSTDGGSDGGLSFGAEGGEISPAADKFPARQSENGKEPGAAC